MKKFIIPIIILITVSLLVFFFKLYDFKRIKNMFFNESKNKSLTPSEMLLSAKRSIQEKMKTFIPPKDAITIHLKNKSVISGTLIEESEDALRINWQGGEVEFKKYEIESIDYGKYTEGKKGNLFEEKRDSDWTYKNDPVLKLYNGSIIDDSIRSVSSDIVLVENKLEGGGSIEQEIKRADIEAIIFKPIKNKRSDDLKESLELQFPKMSFYEEGPITIITDSDRLWVQQFKKALREHYTAFYLDYYDLLKKRSCSTQNFIVVFDYWPDFVNFAIADGVPGWAVAGYFTPHSGVLYSFNALGDKFSEFLYESIVGDVSKQIDTTANTIKSGIDKRYEIFVEGQADEVKKKFQHYHSVLKGIYRDETFDTLRHEFTHQLFYNWGVQNVAMSKVAAEDREKIKKKKEFMEAKDIESKRKALMDLANLRRKDDDIKFDASSSWFVEGLATYSETEPIGEISKRWLFTYQDGARKNSLMPIEFLTLFKMGSFPGISNEAMYSAYGQSWAFVYFLMNNHKKEFLEYLDKIAFGKYSDNENLNLLLQCLNTDLKDLEKEFTEYMSTFEPLEDPYLEQFDTAQRIFSN